MDLVMVNNNIGSGFSGILNLNMRVHGIHGKDPN